MDKKRYEQYVELLHSELVPAMGCTEPIAIAYLASEAFDLLKEDVVSAVIEVSGNILKNVKSVIVPNTGKLKGIEASLAAGLLFGKPERKLEVIADLIPDNRQKIVDFIASHSIEVKYLESPHPFDLILTLNSLNHQVKVRICGYHTNVVYKEKDGEVIYQKPIDKVIIAPDSFKMSVEEIFEFVENVDIDDIKDLLDKQIECNMKIAQEGLKNDYGANVGKVLLSSFGDGVYNQMKAYAAAASDARMNGCEIPVYIVSGSGNQGITASIPLVVYANYHNYSKNELYKALALSNLVTIHLKKGIGRLSAFCGATSAGVGQGAGVAYLNTHDYVTIAHTIVNALGIVSGMVCDGAKASCAAKIQAAIDAGILGYEMYLKGQEFVDGDGLIVKGVENTINNISRLANKGMVETDKEIIEMMIKC